MLGAGAMAGPSLCGALPPLWCVHSSSQMSPVVVNHTLASATVVNCQTSVGGPNLNRRGAVGHLVSCLLVAGLRPLLLVKVSLSLPDRRAMLGPPVDSPSPLMRAIPIPWAGSRVHQVASTGGLIGGEGEGGSGVSTRGSMCGGG
jgi:hypothetical protein